MPKVLICVLDADAITHAAQIDLDHLPPGANAHAVEHFGSQSVGIGAWLQEDLSRAVSVVDNIRNSAWDEESLTVVSALASLAENAPPSTVETDWLVSVTQDKVAILRTSPGVALRAWKGMRSAGIGEA